MIVLVNGSHNNRLQSNPVATVIEDAYTCVKHGERVTCESEFVEPPQGRIVEMDEVVRHAFYCLDCQDEDMEDEMKGKEF